MDAAIDRPDRTDFGTKDLKNVRILGSTGGPGATDGVSDANEVYAKNRPIIKPTIASLGQGAVRANAVSSGESRCRLIRM